MLGDRVPPFCQHAGHKGDVLSILQRERKCAHVQGQADHGTVRRRSVRCWGAAFLAAATRSLPLRFAAATVLALSRCTPNRTVGKRTDTAGKSGKHQSNHEPQCRAHPSHRFQRMATNQFLVNSQARFNARYSHVGQHPAPRFFFGAKDPIHRSQWPKPASTSRSPKPAAPAASILNPSAVLALPAHPLARWPSYADRLRNRPVALASTIATSCNQNGSRMPLRELSFSGDPFAERSAEVESSNRPESPPVKATHTASVTNAAVCIWTVGNPCYQGQTRERRCDGYMSYLSPRTHDHEHERAAGGR